MAKWLPKAATTTEALTDEEGKKYTYRRDPRVQAYGLSEDQKPDDPIEAARILAAGGRIETLPGR
jgi:hypothetical protein